MKTWIDFDAAPVFAIPLTDELGGVTVCEGMLIEGPQGWGEFSPPPGCDGRQAGRWLTAAIEVGTVGWPDPTRGRVPVAVTIPSVGSDRAAQLVTDAERARAEAIRTRRTDRLPFGPPHAWAAVEPVVRSTIDPTMAALHVLSDTVRPQLAEASRLTEALRRYDTSYHAELHWWTGDSVTADGIPYSALASASERERVDIARSFPDPQHLDRRPEVTRDQSVILVLSTYDDTRQDALGCGEVLSDILLEATMAGLATCTLSHLTELDASRSVIRELIGGAGEPQLLIRVGEAPAPGEPPAATPRRPLAEVLQTRG